MGNRRLSRKRLYQVEKLGKKVDLESGAGIENAIKSATQHRQGQELITEIAIDMNPSNETIKLGTATTNVVGKSTTAAHITQLSVAKFGHIVEIRGVTVEALTDASDATVDVDLVTDDAALDQAANPATNNTVVVDGLGVLGADVSNSATFHANMQDGTPAYLYIANGGGESKSTNMKTGKILIYIHGFVAPDDL
jgi:hypothetical protein